MKKIFAIIGFIALMSLPQGCTTTLDKEGVYKGDEILYRTDKSIRAAYDVMHIFVKWEYDNRDMLLKLDPEIKKTADYIRVNAERWINLAIGARDVYKAAPTKENAANVDQILGTLDQAVESATQYITKYGTKLVEKPVSTSK